ncbi:MAG: GTP-binding signal recognition particle G-domain [Bryobacterales bacterium]|nr:GTP-binding signal recognition particle G-domain [Bryobacterales bacterium]
MTQSMHIKTYFSSTVEAAMALARRELGPDAMLMNSRQTPPEVNHLGQYEVVFAARPQFRSLLEKNDVEPHLISELLCDPPLTRNVLASRMESMIVADAALGPAVALVGSSGRGKTSTLLKLALKQPARPIRILVANSSRAGARGPIASFPATLGIDIQCFETVDALDLALNDSHIPTFIDTPAYRPHDMQAAAGLARCLKAHGVDTHLVLRSDARTAEMLRAVERYRMFEPGKLIFTGLDETETLGNLFSVAVRTKKPVSFLCAGQRIPEDLEPATPWRIVEMVLAEGGSPARAAA